MRRVEVKFTPETTNQMEKRRHRRRMYRLALIVVVIQILLLAFFLLRHYELMPAKGTSSAVSTISGNSPSKPGKKSGSVVLTDQAPIFHTGHSISAEKKAGPMHPIDTMKASFHSLYPAFKEGIYGIDVSHWQGVIDWTKPLKGTNNTDIDFVIVKATQGSQYVDSQFEHNWNGAKKAGMKVGAYHFYIYADDPTAQAENFLKNVDWQKGMVRPIIDLELDCESCTTPGVSNETLVKNLKVFIAAVKEKTGLDPILYSYDYFYNTYLKADFAAYDVWLADYTTIAPSMIPVYPNQPGTVDPTYVMWQFTDKQAIQGWSERVDASLLPTQFITKVFIQ